jgi:hypothetical protein
MIPRAPVALVAYASTYAIDRNVSNSCIACVANPAFLAVMRQGS